MILQYDELLSEQETGWWLRFDRREVFIAQSVGEIDEQDRTVGIPGWLVFHKGLEGYVV